MLKRSGIYEAMNVQFNPVWLLKNAKGQPGNVRNSPFMAKERSSIFDVMEQKGIKGVTTKLRLERGKK